MQTILYKPGFILIEFFLSIVVLFLFFIASYPILQKLIELNDVSQIKENLTLIGNCADQYFESEDTNSVSIYEFIGPRKEISVLEFIADEKYPETIFRNHKVSAQSKKYGTITLL